MNDVAIYLFVEPNRADVASREPIPASQSPGIGGRSMLTPGNVGAIVGRPPTGAAGKADPLVIARSPKPSPGGEGGRASARSDEVETPGHCEPVLTLAWQSQGKRPTWQSPKPTGHCEGALAPVAIPHK